jgi:hypothetical protein
MSDEPTQTQPQQAKSRPGSVIGPLILITIGVLFLLSNLGYISSSIWLLLVQFWPLILILFGIEIIFGRTRWGQLLVLLIGLVVAGGLIYVLLNPGQFPIGGSLTTAQIAESGDGVTMAQLELSPGVGELNVTPLASGAANWIEGTVAHSSSQTLEKEYQVTDGNAFMKLDTEGSGFFLGTSSERWNLGLSPHIPIELKINAGVGGSTVDLNALNTPRVDLDTGVGGMKVTMPSHAGTVTARVNGGVGGLTVYIPEGIPARIRADAGIGGVNINQARFPLVAENTYASPDYADATNRIDLSVDSGVGGITIP